MKSRRSMPGWWTVTKLEMRTTILSIKLLIMTAILALAFLAGTYAISPGGSTASLVPSQITFSTIYYENLNSSRPATAAFVIGPTGEPRPNVAFQLVTVTSEAENSLPSRVLETKSTNQSGWVRFENLRECCPNQEVALSLMDTPEHTLLTLSTYSGSSFQVTNQGLLQHRSLALGGAPDRQTLYLAFWDMEGLPITGADVYIADSDEAFMEQGSVPSPLPGGWRRFLNGTTDSNGLFIRMDPIGPGSYILYAAKGELNASARVLVQEVAYPPVEGPDGVLSFTGALFMPLLLPLIAIVHAHESMTSSRSQGTFDLLLSKPVSREGVGLGKLIGGFASISVPVGATILVAAGIAWLRTGMPPTGWFLLAFIFSSMLLLLMYYGLFLAVSANIRKPATVLLMSMLLLLLFAFFWGAIGTLTASLLAPTGSVRWYRTVSLLNLASPSGIYLQLLGSSSPGLIGGLVGLGIGWSDVIPQVWVASALSVWIGVPVALLLTGIKYRVTDD